jgi:hypothetical protein
MTKHFLLGNQFAEARLFTPHDRHPVKSSLPEKDWHAHAIFLQNQYDELYRQAESELTLRSHQGMPEADGVYLDVDAEYILPKLDMSKGAHLMSAFQTEEGARMTVFVKKRQRSWLDKQTRDLKEAAVNRKNGESAKRLVPIRSFEAADIRSLFVPREAFDLIGDEESLPYELWLNHRAEMTDEAVRDVLAQLGIQQVDYKFFTDVQIYLIRARKSQLAELPLSLGHIEGVRPYRQPSVFVRSASEAREWSELFQIATFSSHQDKGVRVGLLDSGVNNAHPLLRDYLPDDRMDKAIGTKDALDYAHHGTDMAGLVLYGDLTELAHHRGTYEDIAHELVSVKIYDPSYEVAPDEDASVRSQFYAVTIESAVDMAGTMGAPLQCMAITDDESWNGSATSSSAALDESLYHQGECDRLVVVSAGNIETEEVDAADYMQSCKAHPLKSPSQAWNALTVGAYTEKSLNEESSYGYQAIGTPGSVSPFSRSSYSWPGKYHRIKPEIVMEGGNVAHSNVMGNSTQPDLSLITTSQDLVRSLEPFHATSAATALAARMMARIKAANPQMSMLTVRAMMTHCARWTPRMEAILPIDERLALCGYGVPQDDLAVTGVDRCATYVFENELQPYQKDKGNVKFHEMHVYDLPFPADVLMNMDQEKVTLRITLSYYVQPAPGVIGRVNKNGYASAMLDFDVKTPTETREEFLSRLNKQDGNKVTQNDSNRWTIKHSRRSASTLQTDWFECTAHQLADCNQIVVYPASGWWKNAKSSGCHNRVKYSLIVSIETEDQEINQAARVALVNALAARVETGR